MTCFLGRHPPQLIGEIPREYLEIVQKWRSFQGLCDFMIISDAPSCPYNMFQLWTIAYIFHLSLGASMPQNGLDCLSRLAFSPGETSKSTICTKGLLRISCHSRHTGISASLFIHRSRFLKMGSGRANALTLWKNHYKNKHNLALGDQFWYQNSPFKEITIKWLEQKDIIFQDTFGI